MNLDQKKSEKTNAEVHNKHEPMHLMTWEEFVQQLGDAIDEDIVSYHKKSGKAYLGGKCTITAAKSWSFRWGMGMQLVIKATLYFSPDNDGKYEQRIIGRKCRYEYFSDDPETQEHLRNIQNVPEEWNIASPI